MVYIISILFCLIATTLSHAMEQLISEESFSREIKIQMDLSNQQITKMILENNISYEEGIARIYAEMSFIDIDMLLKKEDVLELANELWHRLRQDQSIIYIYEEAMFYKKPRNQEELKTSDYQWENFHSVYRTKLLQILREKSIDITNALGIFYFVLNAKIPKNCAPLIQAATIVLFYGRQLEYNARMNR